MSKLKVTTISDPDNNNTALTVASDGKVTLAQDTTFSGNVGIGTSSPSSELHIYNNATSSQFRVQNNDGVAKFQKYQDDLYITNDDTGNVIFANGDSETERMRIDSSGNLLVGKTSVNLATQGFTAKSSGQTQMTTPAGTFPLQLNITGGDGTLTNFYKDGTTVGSIGTYSNDLYIGNNDSGLRFEYAGLNAIVPFDVNSTATSDAQTDLGYSNARFKDLYLSGGAYIGGTGSANYLDDYEEGTWTPIMTDDSSGTATYTYNEGSYTKIGRVVSVWFTMKVSNYSSLSSSDNLYISGLPFTPVDLNNGYPTGTLVTYACAVTLNGHQSLQISDARITLIQNNGQTSNHTGITKSYFDTDTVLRGHIIYHAS